MIRWICALMLAAVLAGAMPAYGWMAFDLSQPFDTLADNSIIDIVYDGAYVWLATGNGVSGTRDGGQTWRSFNTTNGFKRSSISALAASGSRLWVATSYDTSSQPGADRVPAGGGIEITDDRGDNWHLVEPPPASKPGMLAYDLSVYDSAVFAPCFYGGLIRSLDYGETWENVYIDQAHRNDIEKDSFALYSGRYFSSVIDPYHDDTVIVWAGTAQGIQRLYYIGKHKKLASNRINDVAFDSTNWWYATDRGISRFNDSLFTFLTWNTDDGLPANFVSAIGAEKDLICAGFYDTLAQTSLGMMISTNGGNTWHSESPPQATGTGHEIQEIVVYGGSVWAACDSGGLIRSDDEGATWHNYYLDSTQTENSDLRNLIHCVHIAPRDSVTKVFAGSDSGIVEFYFADLSTLDSTRYLPLQDDTAYGQRIVSISTFVTKNGDEIWAASQLLHPADTLRPATIQSTDGGLTWKSHLIGPPAITPTEVRIVEQFRDTLVWVASEEGLRETTNFGQVWNVPFVATTSDTIHSLEPILAVEATSRETHFGTVDQGAAFLAEYGDSTLSALLWTILRANLVPDSLDFVGQSYVVNLVPSDSELAGDFVPAMGLQHRGDSTTIWAAVRATDPYNYQHNGICITKNRGRTWKLVANNVMAWNFEFNGDTCFVPTTGGLMMSTNNGQTWDTLQIVDPVSGRSIEGNVEVYGARFINGDLWVGTNDGVAHSTNLVDWDIIRSFYPIAPSASDGDRSYVSPSPYSPYLADSKMKFHYRLNNPGNVTIKIYDFANNLVKTVVDGVSRQGGVQYDDLDSWDGRNGKGDTVAGGVYLYIIESSGGDKLWGKFMVIP